MNDEKYEISFSMDPMIGKLSDDRQSYNTFDSDSDRAVYDYMKQIISTNNENIRISKLEQLIENIKK